MARHTGGLLSVDITTIDCAQMKSDVGLFGSTAGFHRSEEGSQLNKFLARHNGKRAVVFLDELDKTNEGIGHSLLVCDWGKCNIHPQIFVYLNLHLL